MTAGRAARTFQSRLDGIVARNPSWGPAAIATTWFVLIDVMRLRAIATIPPGFDGRLYREATIAWLAGADPWAVHSGPIRYAAPPPSLLAMVPFAVVPEDVAVAIIIVAGLVGTAWALRRLGLPLWWLVFPPFIDGLYNANPQVLIVPLIVAGATPLAVLVKIYAGLVPLIRGETRVLLISAVLLVITAPLLPWSAYIAAFPELADALRTQSSGGLSAWATPILLPVAAIALITMGRANAAWWSVPVLWPSTQWYYNSLVVPAATIPAGMLVAVPHPVTATLGAVITAWLAWTRRPQVASDRKVLDSATT